MDATKDMVPQNRPPRPPRHGPKPEHPTTGHDEPTEEAENMRIRGRLMDILSRFIKERGMTQHEAADLFGVSQPRISHLMNRKAEKFSIDALVNMHAKTGAIVRFTVATDDARPT
jgi:predicted XRE-type DNA-binding protein